LKRVGTLRRHARRGQETTSFEYHPDWLADKARFSLESALILTVVLLRRRQARRSLARSATPLRTFGAAAAR